ncbi:MAG: CRISPR-associated protein Cas4 [Chloroflexi bacterium]|nr:CRISPR-associated protein Cas4 [Chloroflexota bacterium]
MAGLLAALVVIALLAAFVVRIAARTQRAQTGLPFGARVVYADTGAWEKVERPLFSRRYALTGKPDYIVTHNGAVIPIEVKPNRRASAPRESDVLQLAAYGLLIEETQRVAPPYGLLKYRDAVFQVDFTDALRAQLLAVMDAMRADLDARDVPRHHVESFRCRACGYREECGQALE